MLNQRGLAILRRVRDAVTRRAEGAEGLPDREHAVISVGRARDSQRPDPGLRRTALRTATLMQDLPVRPVARLAVHAEADAEIRTPSSSEPRGREVSAEGAGCEPALTAGNPQSGLRD